MKDLGVAQNNLDNISQLQSLTELNSLDIRDNQIVSLAPIQNHNITDLILDKNSIQDYSVLSQLENITFLSMNYNEVSSLEFVKGMQKLKRLFIEDTQISDLSALENMTELEYIAIRNTGVTTIKPLLTLDNLRFLLLDKNVVQDWSLLEDKERLQISEHTIIAE